MRLRRAAVIALPALLLAAAPARAIMPSADTYVDSASPGTTFGGAQQVEVDASPQQQALLRFDVSGVGGNPVTSAKLRLWVTNGSGSGGEIHKLTGPFDETATTWNTKPALDPAVIGRLGKVTAGAWVETDVTSAVTGDGSVNLGLVSSSTDGAWYASRESGAHAPQLELTLGGGGPPPTAPADTYVDSAAPTTSFGAAQQVEVDASPQQQALLRFDVSGPVTSAKLRLWVTNGSGSGGEVHKLAGPFDETATNWNNRPALDPAVIGRLGKVTAGTWVEVDVTSAVSGSGPVNLGILSSSTDGAWYASRESGAHAPQLVVTAAGSSPLSVGAYYYPWYGTGRRHWSAGYVRNLLDTPQQPLLGEYDSHNAQTVASHFQWAQQYGINTFIVSWWGPGSYEDTTIRDYLLPSPAIGPTKVAAFYESLSLLPVTNGVVDFNNPAAGQKLLADVDYLARTYFSNPGYARVNGKPVVYFYVTRTWRGDYTKAIADLRSTIKARYGYDLYLVADEVDPDGTPTPDRIRLFDAITSYTMYSSRQTPGWPADTGLLPTIRARYDAFKQIADQFGVAFIPDALPSFNDRGVRLAANHYVLPPEVDATTPPGTSSLFSRMLDLDADYLDPNLRALNVTSFNEWHEDTQIEPTAAAPPSSGPATYTQGYTHPSYGFRLLELLRDFRAAHGG
jgi:glycoprotein endo-alpha-1,2-mannosidase